MYMHVALGAVRIDTHVISACSMYNLKHMYSHV